MSNWFVSKSMSVDIERQTLNRILREIRESHDALDARITAVSNNPGGGGEVTFSFQDSPEIDFTSVDGGVTATLFATSVTPDSYGAANSVATFTVDSKGRLTAAGEVLISILHSQVSDFDEAVDDRVSTLIQNGTGLNWTYDDALNTLTGNVTLAPFTTDDLDEGSTNFYVNDADYGDIVVSDDGDVWTINSSVLSTFGRSLIDDADASEARTTLGLGTLATLSPTGTADTTTVLRGDNTWATGVTGQWDVGGNLTVDGVATVNDIFRIDAGTQSTSLTRAVNITGEFTGGARDAFKLTNESTAADAYVGMWLASGASATDAGYLGYFGNEFTTGGGLRQKKVVLLALGTAHAMIQTSNSAGNIYFAPNSSTAMFIEGATGDVGFGTTSPTGSGFETKVVQISSTSPTLAFNCGSGASDFGEFLFQENNTAKWSLGYTANDEKFYLYNYGRGHYDIIADSTTGLVKTRRAWTATEVNAITTVSSAGQTRTFSLSNGWTQTLSANTSFTLNLSGPAGEAGYMVIYIYNPGGGSINLTKGTGWYSGAGTTVALTNGVTHAWAFFWDGTRGLPLSAIPTQGTGDLRPA